MKKLTVLLLLFLLAGCTGNVSQKDLIHGDVYFNGAAVLTFQSADELQELYSSLFENPTPLSLSDSDLSYTLTVKTSNDQYDYKLLFDLKSQQAAALSDSGSFSIPFNWLDSFIEAYPIPESFEYLYPPKMTLTVNDYAMTVGFDQQWNIHPSSSTTIPLTASFASSENYKCQDTDLSICAAFDKMPPDRTLLTIIGTNETLTYDDIDLTSLPHPVTEDAYRYELTCIWEQPELGYSGTITYNFGLSITEPTTYELSHESYEPGDCMAILITNPDSLDYRVETETYGNTVGLFYFGEDLIGLIPLDSSIVPGSYTINVYQDSTDLLLSTIPYEVTYKEFPEQQLTVSSTTASLKSEENYAADAEKFGSAKDYSVGEKLWDSTFLQPVEGRISTEYSTIRYVNGGDESSRHNAIDIAAPQGTPIKAANNGIVTFASDLIISGNVVVLDHGYGIFTSYVHMYEIYVEVGQEVKKGDIIGTVGSTGYSTGPHLHWSIWKNGVYLNPWKFIDEDPLAPFETAETTGEQ